MLVYSEKQLFTLHFNDENLMGIIVGFSEKDDVDLACYNKFVEPPMITTTEVRLFNYKNFKPPLLHTVRKKFLFYFGWP